MKNLRNLLVIIGMGLIIVLAFTGCGSSCSNNHGCVYNPNVDSSVCVSSSCAARIAREERSSSRAFCNC